ncbi:MAG: glycosyltransferase family 4 protein [Chloroflexi bacterium]|nr:glycosyltransferase family 4 protein [Chloroflexota bacterium]
MCEKMVLGLNQKGHDVSVLASSYGSSRPSFLHAAHRKLHYLEEKYRNPFQRRFMQLQHAYLGCRNSVIARRLIEELSPDAVLLWNLEGVSSQVYFGISDLDIPLVWVLGSHWLAHDKAEFDEPVSFLKRYYRLGMLGFNALNEIRLEQSIFVSHSLAQSYKKVGFEIEGSVIIPNGVQESQIGARKEIEDDDIARGLQIVYVGRIEPEKGIDIAVEALHIILEEYHIPDVSLTLVGIGEPEYISALEQSASQKGLNDSVIFAGFLEHDQLMDKYAEYDVLILPTLQFEGFGLTLIEAMSQGLPVIASDIGGPKDIVEHGKNGYLVTPGDAGALAGQLLALWEERHKLPELGKAAIDTIREKFTAEQMINNYEDFIEAAVA